MALGDNLHRKLLARVDKILEEEPTREGLLKLIQIQDPDFEEIDLNDDRKLDSCIRQLSPYIYPDKILEPPFTQVEKAVATKRFQDFSNFCDEARKCKKRKDIFAEFPEYFKITESFRDDSIKAAWKVPKMRHDQRCDKRDVILVTVFRFIHVYGAITHGKEISWYCANTTNVSSEWETAEELMNLWGGYKKLAPNAASIMEHLQNNYGPVLSTSFTPDEEFYKGNTFSDLFKKCEEGETHPVLIVGWETREQEFGLVRCWLVRSLMGNKNVLIPMNHCSIEASPIVPKSNFSDMPWQDPNKAFDVNLEGIEDRFYDLETITRKLSPERFFDLLQILGCPDILDDDFCDKEFILRDQNMKSRSRRASILSIVPLKTTNKRFSVTFGLDEDDS
jgi:hypothetical protein